jgi:L-histidine N-alpha-methyltransferase
MLARMNRELAADFDLANFAHQALWNEQHRRIEMHLRSTVSQTVRIPVAGCAVSFARDETIWTESCHKYNCVEVVRMANRTAFHCQAQWLDREWPFAQSLLIAQ